MRKEFIDEVSKTLSIEKKDLIEKDLMLHQLLLDLSKNKYFSDQYVFKGGTCLIKYYLGYFRFSEDIDFTWKRQEVFDDLQKKEKRKKLSAEINHAGELLEKITQKRGLQFTLDKSDEHYVELGGGGKTVTFKAWYDSEILHRQSFIKIQINFVEKILFKAKKVKLKTLLTVKKDLEALFPQLYNEYSSSIPFFVYDLKEILCEKNRAILTRKGVKARDFLDVYFINKAFKLSPDKVREASLEKTIFALKSYKKYRNNFEEKKKVLGEDFFSWGAERSLLLQKIDEKDFYAFLKEFMAFLQELAEDIVKNLE